MLINSCSCNKNVDIKFSAHDTFMEFRYAQNRKPNKSVATDQISSLCNIYNVSV
jgi:hypothetical protein